jgi:hypothetical protein
MIFMGEDETRSTAEHLWGSLTDVEKDACVYFAVSDWRTGVDKGYIEAMGIEEDILNKLVGQGLVETKPNWKLYQDLADQMRAQVQAIRDRLRQNYSLGYTDEERQLLTEYDRFETIAKRKDEKPRYHLADQKIHNFIRDKYSDE